ncbi:hypothetical protein K2X33_01690 [bacterium]|nr:hypothetical protein [bacterium]
MRAFPLILSLFLLATRAYATLDGCKLMTIILGELETRANASVILGQLKQPENTGAAFHAFDPALYQDWDSTLREEGEPEWLEEFDDSGFVTSARELGAKFYISHYVDMVGWVVSRGGQLEVIAPYLPPGDLEELNRGYDSAALLLQQWQEIQAGLGFPGEFGRRAAYELLETTASAVFQRGVRWLKLLPSGKNLDPLDIIRMGNAPALDAAVAALYLHRKMLMLAGAQEEAGASAALTALAEFQHKEALRFLLMAVRDQQDYTARVGIQKPLAEYDVAFLFGDHFDSLEREERICIERALASLIQGLLEPEP